MYILSIFGNFFMPTFLLYITVFAKKTWDLGGGDQFDPPQIPAYPGDRVCLFITYNLKKFDRNLNLNKKVVFIALI